MDTADAPAPMISASARPARVVLQYFDGCPSWKPVDEHLRLLAGELGFELELHRVADTDAESIGFRGSPTILVDGSDPFGGDDRPGGLSCRIYDTPDGPAGSPTLQQLRDVLAASRDMRDRGDGTLSR